MKAHGKHAEETAQRVLKAFENPEKLPAALAPLFIHRDDDTPARNWSWRNQMIAAVLGGTMDARGYKQWQKAGRQVKRGSKAIWILVPLSKTWKEEDPDTGEEKQKSAIYGFKAAPVFAVEDTEGPPLPGPDPAAREWLESLPFADVAREWGIEIDCYNGADRAALGFYSHGNRGKKIALGDRRASTWAHELSHAADHLQTGLSGGRNACEIVAELSGAILMETLGRHEDADLGGAYKYIQAWARDKGWTPLQAATKVLNRACNSVNLILSTARELEAKQEPAAAAM